MGDGRARHEQAEPEPEGREREGEAGSPCDEAADPGHDEATEGAESAGQADGCGEVTLQGTNESLPLPSVFKFIGQTKKSGTLRVMTNDEKLTFQILDGNLVFSSTNNPPSAREARG